MSGTLFFEHNIFTSAFRGYVDESYPARVRELNSSRVVRWRAINCVSDRQHCSMCTRAEIGVCGQSTEKSHSQPQNNSQAEEDIQIRRQP
jgi:hypothetical protein